VSSEEQQGQAPEGQATPGDPGPGASAGSPGAGEPSPGPGPAAGPDPGREPSEAELRAAYEAELARITSTDMILQAAVSLLNLGSYRLVPRPPAGGGAGAPDAGPGAPPGAGQDLDQVRDSVDAIRALLEILERRVPSELGPLRDALSQLQMAYAREVGAAGGTPEGGPGGGPGSGGEGGPGGSGGGPGPAPGGPGEQGKPGPGPAESSGRLWVPGQ
jgi:hypothetical protein